MRAAVVSGGSLSIEDRASPEPGADQVLVEVIAAGVNRADLLQVRGLYPAPPGWPEDIPGLEFSGVVRAAGPAVGRLKEGDRVFGLVGGGGHSTYLLAPESHCVPLPQSLDPVEAGGVPEVFITAHDALVTRAGLQSGERVLIHGVGSGVGTAAVQIIRALGATSVGTGRTPEKLERTRELGLDEAVEAGPDMAGRIGEVDVVIDLVGGDYVTTDVEVCKTRGRIVLVGLLAGASTNLDLASVMRKRLQITGTTLRNRPDYERALATAAFAKSIVPLFGRKLLRPVVERVVDFDDISIAYEAAGSNQTFGKVILAMGG
jgi:NADPH2:quinone reductase